MEKRPSSSSEDGSSLQVALSFRIQVSIDLGSGNSFDFAMWRGDVPIQRNPMEIGRCDGRVQTHTATAQLDGGAVPEACS